MTKNHDSLYSRAKKLIPGGTHLFSKKPEIFLPNGWPTYFDRTEGCFIWDLNNRKLIDTCLMGVGTNSLGYSNEFVDSAVKQVVLKGNMSTLNCPEEVYLAEKLCNLHPWAGMVRFTRTGGEAMAVAIRMARANNNKPNIAVCGYHGWHDWYLSANIGDNENLSDLLMPGLGSKGVPRNLKGMTHTFLYNNIDSLKKLLETNTFCTVVMEVMRNYEPEDDFLNKVRDLTKKHNVILIFDECSSGFRETFGGLHKKYNVEPDILMLGKALGNGYAINGIIGKEYLMEKVNECFISSTFWTERIGPTAALATLEEMERITSWEVINGIGIRIKAKWKNLSNKYNVPIDIYGLNALATFTFKEDHLLNKTFLTKFMLDYGYLASTIFYSSTSHSNNILEGFFNTLEECFLKIKKLSNEEKLKYVGGEISQSGFKRLN
jgi:glutamate-1-semialdehyde aminotransferase